MKRSAPVSKPLAQPDPALRRAQEANDWPELVRQCRQVLRKRPADRWAHRYLGFALHKQKEHEAALEAFREAEKHWPVDAELLINHAQTLMELGREAEAVPIMEKVIELRPDHYLAWLKTSQALYRTQSHARGWECALKTEQLSKTTSERALALIQKAIHRRELGQVKEAIQDCEACLALDPGNLAAHTNRLLFMLADPAVTAYDIRRATEEYARVVEVPLKPRWPMHERTNRQPWQRLRVGFLSPDLRNHAVVYSVEGLLAQLDRRGFSVIALHLHPGGDHITERIKRHADEFIELANHALQEQVQLILDAKLDILIDLAGHTGNNGLLLMAMKLVPIQVSWLGYPATTGLTAIDYKFTDEVTDPEGADDQYSERLYRLPTLFSCYRPLIRNPLWRYQPAYQVRPTPSVQNGYVTFGSCNNLGKLTDDVLRLWGRILATVPNSRLLIEGKSLDQAEFAGNYRKRCARLGIDTSRLELVPLEVKNQYLTYHRIDIALDPFPLTGGTTTFDLLWMGVPLVSMVGDSFKSRLSTGILTYLGRTEWLANNTEEYVRIARDLAVDVHGLNTLRLGLRHEVERSVLMREDLYCQHFGEGLRLMWLQWLAQGAHPDDPEAQSHLIASWLPSLPPEWSEAPIPGVGMEPGLRLPLPQVHQKLDELLTRARQQLPESDQHHIQQGAWAEVTELAERVLCAVPHDPVALACLAEVEHAHGHTEFAVTYLRYAQEAMSAKV